MTSAKPSQFPDPQHLRCHDAGFGVLPLPVCCLQAACGHSDVSLVTSPNGPPRASQINIAASQAGFSFSHGLWGAERRTFPPAPQERVSGPAGVPLRNYSHSDPQRVGLLFLLPHP